MYRQAYSLVELSIVLIIIGLLVAGVSSGTKLMQQAKLYRVVAEFTDYKGSINTFLLTYNSMPGDFDKATEFWSGTNLANGDNNGKIDSTEYQQAFYHLTLANLSKVSTLDYNLFPESDLGKNNAVYHLDYRSNWFNSTGNMLILNKSHWKGVMKAIEAYNIDRKIDDGFAHKGKMLGITGANSDGTACATAWTGGCAACSAHELGSPVDYNKSDSQEACFLMYKLGI